MATLVQPPQGPWFAPPNPMSGDLLTVPELTALSLAPKQASPASASASAARQAWNLPAKIAVGRQIANEELQKYPTHNDAGDAMRHAEWSQRMGTDIGPVFSTLVGVGHEGQNVFDSIRQNLGKFVDPSAYAGQTVPSVGQTLEESAMDMHNNAAGLHAAMAGVPIDPAKLQISPGGAPYQDD